MFGHNMLENMLECTFEHGEVFAKIIDAVKDLCQEGNIDFTTNGVNMQIMDAAHVSLCCIVLRTNTFKTYKCSENVSLGLNFKSLAMVLRGAKGQLTMKHNHSDTLDVSVNKLDGTATYNLKLMDIDSEYLGLPDKPHEALCVLSANTLAKVIKDLGDFSDTCTIHITEKFHIDVQGDVGKVQWESEDAKCSVQQDVAPLMFGTRYLSIFTKAAAVAQKVVVGVSENTPICLTYPLEHGHIRYYLAPKNTD